MSMLFKSQLRRFLFAASPRLATAIQSARARAYSHELVRRWGCLELNRKLIQQFGRLVLHGPFSNLILTPITATEHLAPYLLGTYESELHPTIESILGQPFRQIVDVGAKFGFYAVGFARHFPEAEVVAFDTDWWARKAMAEMKVQNETPNVLIEAFCDPEWFKSRLKPAAFILSDCEGFEAVLFTKLHATALLSATMLIEIHEAVSPGVEKEIAALFSATHDVLKIAHDPERTFKLPELEALDPPERSLAVNEFRAKEQSWLFLKPKDIGIV